MNLVKMFCDIDDFCQELEPFWHSKLIETYNKKRQRSSKLCLSEIMTVVIAFHQSNYRTFKHYYLNFVCRYWYKEFPNLVSYNRFVELMSAALVPLTIYLNSRKGRMTGISFVDSCALKVCHNLRIRAHKVLRGVAQLGKTSTGWFYGFKLHLIINDRGELLAFQVTPGNVDDRKPVSAMSKNIFGKLFGDRGYISRKLFELLYKNGLQLITSLKKNMKNKLLPMIDKLLLRKRSIIETVNDQLKNISQIEHSRHRSLTNFLVNLVAGLIAYTYQDKKPSLNLKWENQNLFPIAF